MESLFSEFKPCTAAEWKAQIMKDLKGEPFESLIWRNENGIDIKPFYTTEDQKQKYEPVFTHADWDICVQADTPAEGQTLNTFFVQNLNCGASSIALHTEGKDIKKALQDVQLNFIQSTFYTGTQDAIRLNDYFTGQYTNKEVQCSLFPLKFDQPEDLREWIQTIELFKSRPAVRTVAVDVLPFHNQNCDPYFELALIFLMLVEYLEALVQKGEMPSSAVVIKTGVNADFFVQIAKLRAIRRLWFLFKKEYKIQNDLHLIVETSLTNKSISDKYNNLLRSTIETMAAVAGGCNECVVQPFDVFSERNKDLSDRLAINQQLILKEEVYLNKVADISCGSYYIENLTDALGEKALATFKRLEKEGGFFNCLNSGLLKKEIEGQAKEKAKKFEELVTISIGVNKFRNEKEQFEIPASAIALIKKSEFYNPCLNYELKHFYT